MPSLTWMGKRPAAPKPATLSTDSILHPGGRGYPKARVDGRLILGDKVVILRLMENLQYLINI